MAFVDEVRGILVTLHHRWKPLVLTDVVFKAVAFILLTPLAVGLLHLSLWAAGAGTLADADIVLFFIQPLGWAVLVLGGAVLLGIVAAEQATLLVMLLAPPDEMVGVGTAFGWVAARGRQIVALTGRLVAFTAAAAAPFLVLAVVIAAVLLRDYDINYYLATWPASFQLAVGLGVVLLVGLLAVVAWLCAGWFLALPIVLFEPHAAAAAMAESRRRVAGSKRLVLLLLISWGAASFLVSVLATSGVVLVARQLVPLATGGLPQLVLAIGGTLAAWFAVGLLVNVLTTILFAAMITEVYRRLSPADILHRRLEPAAEDGLGGEGLPSFSSGRRLLLSVCVGCLLVAAAGTIAVHDVRFEDDVVVIGHRGAGGLAPENTLAAIEKAIAFGADWVEIDVQESADGVVMVVHDSDLMKLAGVDLKIWNGTRAELEAIDVGRGFDPRFTGERVPTLADVLNACCGRVGVTIELKDYGHGQRLEERVAEIVEAHGMDQDVIVMSLKPAMVKRMKALRPAWVVGLLMSVAVGDASTLEADFLAVNARFVSRALVRRAHRVGKKVYAWTLNDDVSLSMLISRGVDGVITDYPDLAAAVLKQRAMLSPVERVLLELAEVLGVKVRLPALDATSTGEA
jgi:glycerophosphoryl diester phosphodiesterase